MKPADKLADCIYIVAGDAQRNELSAILGSQGFHVAGFATGVACLVATRRRRPACIILDAPLSDGSAREFVAELRRRKCTAPVFIACAEAKDPTKFEAVPASAVDFIDKPFNPATLVGRVRDAIAGSMRHISNPAAPRPVATHFPGCEMLTPREHEVLALIAGGASNKEAGRRLGISPRTVEVHRARIMEKLGARNTVELVHRVLADHG